MDLNEQLKKLFPDHVPTGDSRPDKSDPALWLQDVPLICKYEKRKGKPVTLIEGYTGAEADFKSLTKAHGERVLHSTKASGSHGTEIIGSVLSFLGLGGHFVEACC